MMVQRTVVCFREVQFINNRQVVSEAINKPLKAAPNQGEHLILIPVVCTVGIHLLCRFPSTDQFNSQHLSIQFKMVETLTLNVLTLNVLVVLIVVVPID